LGISRTIDIPQSNKLKPFFIEFCFDTLQKELFKFMKNPEGYCLPKLANAPSRREMVNNENYSYTFCTTILGENRISYF
jgi:hypothetical protein